jgi:hypothetical protein
MNSKISDRFEVAFPLKSPVPPDRKTSAAHSTEQPSAKPISASVCGICDAPTKTSEGRVLTAREVLENPHYWERTFELEETTEDNLVLRVLAHSMRRKHWLLCPACVQACKCDAARRQPADGGESEDAPLRPDQVAIYAGAAWYRRTGKWPSALRTADGRPGPDEAERLMRAVYGEDDGGADVRTR